MKKFEPFTGLAAPLDRANVDTDAIIPKQYLKSIKRTGFGPNLFDDWRYREPGEPGMDHGQRKLNPEFILNQPRYRGAGILLVRENFGCGSSREHAVWSLMEYGFRALIGPSYAELFYNNAIKNGLLPVVLPRDNIDRLFRETTATEDYRLTVDLAAKTVITPAGKVFGFDIDASNKQRLLEGLDDIELTLQQADAIRVYEAKRRKEVPWLFK